MGGDVGADPVPRAQVVRGVDLGDLDADGGGADAWGNGNRPLSGLATYGGTGGIIVDNAGGAAGTAQVYFAHGGNSDGSGNAVQASQSALD